MSETKTIDGSQWETALSSARECVQNFEECVAAHCAVKAHGRSMAGGRDTYVDLQKERAALVSHIAKLQAGIERIGAERDQMEAANKQQADEISRLNAIIAGMASLPATSEPRS